jgi:hypothetical protein
MSMASVRIYLATGEVPISFLRIPIKDVKRLSVRPFKWLRFVMYSICGALGDISATPDGDPVEYNSTELADVSTELDDVSTELADVDAKYYYKPRGKVCFYM